MDLDAYLARLGLDRPGTVDAHALRKLQVRHLEVIPFENLSVHLGEPIGLAEDALFDKIVQRRRGGFCYELNGAFSFLLRELGFKVTLLAAKVFGPDGWLGPPFDHLALRVDLDEPWLVDVGFGRFSRHPLRLYGVDAQHDPDGEFVLLDGPDGDIDVHQDGVPGYRLETRARQLSEFVPMAWWHSTSPASHFTQGPTCSLPTAGGRITLAGDRLIESIDGVRTERTLAGDQEILDAYRVNFGITLDKVPACPSK
jgi:N-hydroxyarylamine O-acetyltransferase